MNINKDSIHTMCGVDYFNLTDDTIFEFGMEVKTWAGEKVNRVDVRARKVGFARKIDVITETGRRFTVKVAEGSERSLIPLHHFA